MLLWRSNTVDANGKSLLQKQVLNCLDKDTSGYTSVTPAEQKFKTKISNKRKDCNNLAIKMKKD